MQPKKKKCGGFATTVRTSGTAQDWQDCWPTDHTRTFSPGNPAILSVPVSSQNSPDFVLNLIEQGWNDLRFFFVFFSSLAERAITAVPVTALPLEAIVTSSAI